MKAQRQKVGTSATDTLPTSLLTETALGNQVGPADGGIPGATSASTRQQLGAAGIIYDNTKPLHRRCGKRRTISLSAQRDSGGAALSADARASEDPRALYDGHRRWARCRWQRERPGRELKETGTGLFNSNQWTERVDYTINEKMHAFERFSRFWDTLSGTVMFGAAGGPGFGISNYGGNSNGANDSLASGMDIALSPKLLTDFRLGYYRYNVIDTKHDQGTEFANTLGIPGINIGGNITSGSPGFN